jgi:DNA-binding NtrC family response regulator
MLRVTLRAGDRFQVFAVPAHPQVLGSGEDCELRFAGRGISRRHARLVGVEGGVRVEDVASRNGLWLRGKRCAEAVLAPGDRLQVGEAWLSVEEVSTSDAEAELRLPRSPTVAAEAVEQSTGTPGAIVAPAGSMAAVLRLVRLLERAPVAPVGAGRERLLCEARGALGAQTLLVFRVQRSEPVVAEWSGASSSHAVLDSLAAEAARVRRRSEPVFIDTEEGVALLCGLAGSPWALAAVPAPGVPLEASCADLLPYLAEWLLSPEPPAVSGGGVSEAEETQLPVPAGMVIGNSAVMRDLVRAIRATAGSQQHVLLLGENGTGKERFARLIHDMGPHAKGPYLPINCAAIPGELFEAEMFGVHGRAATGVDPRAGHFARADGGTLFLDEIGDLREDLQAKLLRALQEREIAPVGASSARQINVRVVSASNRDLEGDVRAGTFRQDLYYRLRGRIFRIPALRERKEDLPELVLSFITRFANSHSRQITGVSRRALRLLREHDWPGNVRELESACEAAVLLCPQGGVVGAEHFPEVRSPGTPASTQPDVPPPRTDGGDATAAGVRGKIHDLQRRAVLDALADARGNKSKAAKILGVNRATLYLWLAKLGIQR